MVWCSHLFQNFPQFIVIHTVKGFGIVCHLAYWSLWLCAQLLSCVQLCDPRTVACQAPPSMGFSRQEYWSGLPFPFPEDLPYPGIKPMSPALQVNSLPTEPAEKPNTSLHLNSESSKRKNLCRCTMTARSKI